MLHLIYVIGADAIVFCSHWFGDNAFGTARVAVAVQDRFNSGEA